MTQNQSTAAPRSLDAESSGWTADDDARLSSSRRRRARVVLALAALIVAAVTLRGCLPLVLPADISEGPMLQQVTMDSAIIVWWTTKEGDFKLQYGPDGQVLAPAEVERRGDMFRVYLTGLRPETLYAYRILRDDRDLFGASFQTAKPPGRPIRYVVVGDTGRATRAQFQIAGRITDAGADFVVHTGDVVYPAGERFNYRSRFFEPNKDFLKSIAIWPSIGNHDAARAGGGGDPYREVFDLPHNGPNGHPPENNYYFDYGDARFVVIDTNQSEDTLRDVLAPWAQAALTMPDSKRWRFAVFHHPPYTAGRYAPNSAVQRTLVPAFEAAGVHVVFCGHDHMYQRTKPMRGGQAAEPGHGIVYVVSGAGGADLYTAKESRPDHFESVRDQVHSFSVVDIEGDTLRFQQIDVSGGVLDDWSLTIPSGEAPTQPAEASP